MNASMICALYFCVCVNQIWYHISYFCITVTKIPNRNNGAEIHSDPQFVRVPAHGSGWGMVMFRWLGMHLIRGRNNFKALHLWPTPAIVAPPPRGSTWNSSTWNGNQALKTGACGRLWEAFWVSAMPSCIHFIPCCECAYLLCHFYFQLIILLPLLLFQFILILCLIFWVTVYMTEYCPFEVLICELSATRDL